MEEQTVDDVIFKIEDYVGGNIEGVEHIDRMGFTVFLRHALNALIAQEQVALIGDDMTEPPEDCADDAYAIGIMAGYNLAKKEQRIALAAIKAELNSKEEK